MSVAENHRGSRLIDYFMLLAIAENTLLAWEPTRRIVPTTITRITASITAYSAMSWPRSSDHSLLTNTAITASYVLLLFRSFPPWNLMVASFSLTSDRHPLRAP